MAARLIAVKSGQLQPLRTGCEAVRLVIAGPRVSATTDAMLLK
jgi:hypothetical protein